MQFVDASGNLAGAPRDQLVEPHRLALEPGKASSGATTVFAAPTANAAQVLVLYKAYWNMVLLNNDNTFGIHNPAFFDARLARRRPSS